MQTYTATGDIVHVSLFSARTRTRLRVAAITVAALAMFSGSALAVAQLRAAPAGPTALECELAPNSTAGC